jgi:hypothetical protein
MGKPGGVQSGDIPLCLGLVKPSVVEQVWRVAAVGRVSFVGSLTVGVLEVRHGDNVGQFSSVVMLEECCWCQQSLLDILG